MSKLCFVKNTDIVPVNLLSVRNIKRFNLLLRFCFPYENETAYITIKLLILLKLNTYHRYCLS